MHIHILGICGTFMGGLAAIAKDAGHKVTGCDVNVYPPMSDQLKARSIPLIEGFGQDQIALNPDLWVIGNVVSRGNPLMEAILNRGDRYASGPQWLYENILCDKRVLAVAGTHGKTTTASMLAWILEEAGLAPGFLIGGVPKNFETSSKLGENPFFVVEADEYDTAYFDKRSKFLHYRPQVAILNNIEFDHADIFENIAAIERQFHHFLRTIPSSGKIIANAPDDAIERVIAKGCWTPVERFGTGQEWDALEVDGGSFEVVRNTKPLGRVSWDLLGKHNQLNALAAIAAAAAVGVAPDRAIAALSGFKGVKRRMELRGVVRDIFVYDDFAHHPTAFAATIAGLRKKIGGARILAVLEPRSNTMKLGVMKDQLAGSLMTADKIFCFTAHLEWDAPMALAPLGDKARCEDQLGRLVEAIVAEARSGDHVLVMSNGGFGGIHDRLLAALGRGA